MLKTTLTQAISFANAGFTVIKLKGKKPVGFRWTKAKYLWPEEVEESFKTWEDNYGVLISRGWLVIDADPRHYLEGDRPLKRLLADCGLNLKKYGAISITGGGGYHIFLKIPKGLYIKEVQEQYKGLEFKTKGRQVVGPGSIHPDTRKPYALSPKSLPLSKIEEVPKALLDIIARPEIQKPPNKPDIKDVMDDNAGVEERYIEYLLAAEPAIQGDRGDATTYATACKGQDFGFSQEKTLELMMKHYNSRCSPEWDFKDLEDKVRNAYAYSTGSYGQALPASDFQKISTEGKHPKWRGWDRPNGKLDKSSTNNIQNFFIETGSPLRGSLMFNEFSEQIQVMKPLPWWQDTIKTIPPQGVQWKGGDTVGCRLWLSRERNFHVKKPDINDAALGVAQFESFHPVKDYLNNLKWDGKKRIDTWLMDYASAKKTKVNREICRLLLMQAVERIYRPGCQADYTVVLEGEQGVGKSSIVAILGGEFYGDFHIDPHNKDSISDMMGKWFLEISEMVSTRKADADSLKAFLTRRKDTVRLPYAAKSEDYPRRCVFIGTINPGALAEYLKDETGNRRFLPIEIFKVNFRGLERARDQLFAEATERVLQGDQIHITDSEVLKTLEDEQRKRQMQDPWLDAIENWVHQNKKRFVTTRDIWLWALKGAEAQIKHNDRRRISEVLKTLGYKKGVARVEGRNTRGYVNHSYVKAGKTE